MRGATIACGSAITSKANFNPRPPCGERPVCLISVPKYENFNPRPPCGERHARIDDLSTIVQISIHAPHAGSDTSPIKRGRQIVDFNPRPPCGERHIACGSAITSKANFNPRPPCGERQKKSFCVGKHIRISIHAPHAGSDDVERAESEVFKRISIHAPHAGSDCVVSPYSSIPFLFQSTPPMRGATQSAGEIYQYQLISIHAPHAGSDSHIHFNVSQLIDLNTRPPCGERL